MKTSTAFAILALLAAGTNAVPISRRDGGECPCELLDPNNAISNAHTIHNDNADLLRDPLRDDKVLGSSNSASQQSADNNGSTPAEAQSAPEETQSTPTEPEPEASSDSNDPESESFNGSKTAFRAKRPSSSSNNDDVEESDDFMKGADLNTMSSSTDDAVQDGENSLGVEGTIDNVLPGNGTQEKVENAGESVSGGGSGDELNDGVKSLGLDGPVDGAAPGENVGDKVDNIITPQSTDGGNNGENPVIQTGKAVNDAVTEHTGSSTNDHVDSVTSRPVEHVGETVAPVTASKVTPTTDGPVSSAPEILIPGSGTAVNDAAHGPVSNAADALVPGTGPKVNDIADGPTSNVAEGVVPGSGSSVQQATAQPADMTVNQALAGDSQVIDPIIDNSNRPALAGGSPLSDDLLSGMPEIDMNVAVRPPQGQSASSQSTQPESESAQDDSTSTLPTAFRAVRPVAGGLTGPATGQLQNGQLGDSVRPIGASVLGGSPSNLLAGGSLGVDSLPVGGAQQLTGPLVGTARPLTSGGGLANIVSGGGGLPIIGTLARPQGSPLGTDDVNGLPIVSMLNRPQGDSINTDRVQGLPVVNTLAQPQAANPVGDVVSDEEMPSTFGGGGRLFASKVRPAVNNANDDIDEIPESTEDGPDGLVNVVSDDLAKENIEACRDCVEKATEPATGRVSDGEKLVESDPAGVEAAVAPAANRLSTAGNIAQSDPLRVRPAVNNPDSMLPVSYECATSPVTKMPVYTTPCLTNWGGRVGEEVDMCISQNQLASRPDYTMACPNEMQDQPVDDFGLLRRDDNDEEWDMLSRGIVDQYVRLCLIANGL